MAFIEDDGPSEPSQQYTSPLMNYDAGALIALVLQFIAGAVAIYYALPGFISLALLFSLLGASLSMQIYFVVWGLLPIMGIVQIYFGYRIYKKNSEVIGKAILTDIVAILLFGIDIVVSAFENLLFAYPEVIAYFGMNLLLVILLNMASIRSQFSSQPTSNHSEYYQY